MQENYSIQSAKAILLIGMYYRQPLLIKEILIVWQQDKVHTLVECSLVKFILYTVELIYVVFLMCMY